MFDQLITNYQTACRRVDDLATLWDKPVCGVPGFGFKAARNACITRQAASLAMIEAQKALTLWARDTKRSYKERQARLAKIRAVVPNFESCDV